MKKKLKSKADKFIHYFGEGTVWDLDYGKLLILFICISVSYTHLTLPTKRIV